MVNGCGVNVIIDQDSFSIDFASEGAWDLHVRRMTDNGQRKKPNHIVL